MLLVSLADLTCELLRNCQRMKFLREAQSTFPLRERSSQDSKVISGRIVNLWIGFGVRTRWRVVNIVLFHVAAEEGRNVSDQQIPVKKGPWQGLTMVLRTCGSQDMTTMRVWTLENNAMVTTPNR